VCLTERNEPQKQTGTHEEERGCKEGKEQHTKQRNREKKRLLRLLTNTNRDIKREEEEIC